MTILSITSSASTHSHLYYHYSSMILLIMMDNPSIISSLIPKTTSYFLLLYPYPNITQLLSLHSHQISFFLKNSTRPLDFGLLYDCSHHNFATKEFVKLPGQTYMHLIQQYHNNIHSLLMMAS